LTSKKNQETKKELGAKDRAFSANIIPAIIPKLASHP